MPHAEADGADVTETKTKNQNSAKGTTLKMKEHHTAASAERNGMGISMGVLRPWTAAVAMAAGRRPE